MVGRVCMLLRFQQNLLHDHFFFFFFFNDTATTEIYTLSLHDALPILGCRSSSTSSTTTSVPRGTISATSGRTSPTATAQDRKSTRLNSSHSQISYAVFCLKKKKTPIKVNIILVPLRLLHSIYKCIALC